MLYTAPLKTFGRLRNKDNLSSSLFIPEATVAPNPPPQKIINTQYDFSKNHTIEEL
jgi:hypothetical protein